jgi:hypothetical protein
MADNSSAFIQAVFHVILFIVIHGHRGQRGFKARRKRTERRVTRSVTCATDRP